MFPSQKLDHETLGAIADMASMGPGCFHPRNGGAAVVLTEDATLQWGRDVSIPEIVTELGIKD